MTTDTGEISVLIEDVGWLGQLLGVEGLIDDAVRATLAAVCPGLACAGVAVTLTNDLNIHMLNRQWRNKDAPTNVLSFPATDTVEGETPEPDFPGTPLELGDVVVARETCQREALEQKKPLRDHLLHLTIHGTLHLLGYDHEEDEQALRMERQEALILAGFDVPDPYGQPECIDHG